MTPHASNTKRTMHVVRYVLPAATVFAGVALLVAGGADGIALEGAVMLVGAGLSVYLLNWLYRIGVSGDQDRAREDAARRHFDRHSRWPDGVPGRPPA